MPAGKVKEAAINAKTYLAFHPDDPIMVSNIKLYLELLQIAESEITVRTVSGNIILYHYYYC